MRHMRKGKTMMPKLVKAYQGENCSEISTECGGPIFWECKCGGLCFYQNDKERWYCGLCGKFVKKSSDISCKVCEEDRWQDEADGVRKIKALLFPDSTLRTIRDCWEENEVVLFWVF
jgi:hypothetical protein